MAVPAFETVRTHQIGELCAQVSSDQRFQTISQTSAMDNQTGSAADKKRNKLGYHRTSVACVHCRRRKIRCLVAPDDAQGRCENCIRLKKECHFYPVDQQPPMDKRGHPLSKLDTESSMPHSPPGSGNMVDQKDSYFSYSMPLNSGHDVSPFGIATNHLPSYNPGAHDFGSVRPLNPSVPWDDPSLYDQQIPGSGTKAPMSDPTLWAHGMPLNTLPSTPPVAGTQNNPSIVAPTVHNSAPYGVSPDPSSWNPPVQYPSQLAQPADMYASTAAPGLVPVPVTTYAGQSPAAAYPSWDTLAGHPAMHSPQSMTGSNPEPLGAWYPTDHSVNPRRSRHNPG